MGDAGDYTPSTTTGRRRTGNSCAASPTSRGSGSTFLSRPGEPALSFPHGEEDVATLAAGAAATSTEADLSLAVFRSRRRRLAARNALSARTNSMAPAAHSLISHQADTTS